jgi:hypothetical protein
MLFLLLIALLLPSGASRVVDQLPNHLQVGCHRGVRGAVAVDLPLEVFSIFTELGVGFGFAKFSNRDSC